QMSISQVVTAGQVGAGIQVHMQAAGVWIDDVDVTITPIPEPATLGLFGLIGGSMLWIRKRFTI
ncbi:MAG: hypothetical protein DRP64_20010, partial [Verrucomicrobia bacterium]